MPPLNAFQCELPLEALSAAVLIFDEGYRLVQWSAGAGRLFAFSNENPAPATSMLVPPGTVPYWNHALSETQRVGLWDGELELQTTSGAPLSIEVSLRKHTASGRDMIILCATNLTRRLQHERSRRQSWQRRTVERLTRAAAQELRRLPEPMRTMAAQHELLSQAADTVIDEPPGPGGSLLLVGGTPLVRECLRLLLEARGFDVCPASDGHEALECFESQRSGVQAVVLDSDLPGWGTAATITALRRKEPLLPIVLLGDLEGRRIADRVQAVIPRPFRFDDVLWGIEECLRA